MTQESKIDKLVILLEDLLRTGGINKIFYISPKPELAVTQGANLSSVDRLAIPLAGCHRMEIPDGNEIVTIAPVRHTATFMPQGCWNKPDWLLPVEVVTFAFYKDSFSYSFVTCEGKGLHERSVARGQVNRHDPDGYSVLQLMREIGSDFIKDIRSAPLTQALADYCLEALKAQPAEDFGKAHSTYRNICDYLDECYSSDLSREAVAKVFGISPNYLSNLFKSQSRSNFSDYINNLRIKRACYLLTHFKQNLDEIAFSCGFHDTGYFCRVFKKHNACTPGEFRRNQKNSAE